MPAVKKWYTSILLPTTVYVKITQEPENYVTKNSTIVGSWGCGDVLEEGSKGNYMLCLACDLPM